jgi:hypothetical protein
MSRLAPTQPSKPRSRNGTLEGSRYWTAETSEKRAGAGSCIEENGHPASFIQPNPEGSHAALRMALQCDVAEAGFATAAFLQIPGIDDLNGGLHCNGAKKDALDNDGACTDTPRKADSMANEPGWKDVVCEQSISYLEEGIRSALSWQDAHVGLVMIDGSVDRARRQ